jgi:hypothetical protein
MKLFLANTMLFVGSIWENESGSFLFVLSLWLLVAARKLCSISNGKNTGSGTKPTLSLYLIQLSTYVPYYLTAFGAILMYSFWQVPSDPTHVKVRTILQQNVEHKQTY